MSRIRSVHPGFFKDERLVATSMAARLLFIGLGVESDDKGIFEWKPLTIKMNVFPGDNLDVGVLLAELESADAIRAFEIEGRKYGAIRNFRKFQRPKTPNSVHPITDDISNYVSLTAETSTKSPDEVGSFPPKGEKSFQMKDVGGRRKEKKKNPPDPQGGEGDLFDQVWQVFPHHPSSVKMSARKLFDSLSPADQLDLLSKAKRYLAWWSEDCTRRKETQETRLGFVPHLSTWIKTDAWRQADTLPVKAATVTQINADVEYVDRFANEVLFKRCEQMLGRNAPASMQRYGFPREVFEAAKSGDMGQRQAS